MIYQVLWQEEAEGDLRTLPRKEAIAIVKKVESYLAKAPEKLGKPLTGSFSGLYRYRYGDYRVLYTVQARLLQVHVVRVGHRKEIDD